MRCRYELSTLETQTRHLADLAFLMQDYDTALTNYKLVAAEYKADKALRHFAGAMVRDRERELHALLLRCASIAPAFPSPADLLTGLRV